MNHYPLWKYLLILLVISFGAIYALPNLYAPDPAIQVSGQSSGTIIDEPLMSTVAAALKESGIEYFGEEASGDNGLIRLKDREQQLSAKSVIQKALGENYIVALNLAPTTPEWLANMGASPMKLGLDLSGGVHFLLEVNTEEAVAKRMETMVREVRSAMREEKLRYKSVKLVNKKTIINSFNSEEDRDIGSSILRKNFREVSRQLSEENGLFIIRSELLESAVKEIEDYALNQNLTTLRNRVNELGVSEPIVQRQGRNRVVVELPGVQDTSGAKRIIGKTANLEFRLEAKQGSISREKFEFSDPAKRPRDAYLDRSIVITGDHVSDAKSEFDENGMPQVGISLDGDGGARMHRASRKNIGRRLGVLFIEYKTRMKDGVDENGEQVQVPERYVEKKIISLATIQSALGVSFRITGLDSPREASELALLLRAGALAAPMYFVEERTIGPSLGAENVALGIKSVTIGMMLVLSFMLIYYKVFGIFANIALSLNLVILVAAMSILGATLTLPGIAGIVLTVGMAVDANVLIFSRIKEELANGLPPQSAINAGYDRAFVSIIDANLTTLIVAVILYAIGSGPVQGFAVTLSIGILTSMFTAIVGTRALVNLVFGGRNINKVWI